MSSEIFIDPSKTAVLEHGVMSSDHLTFREAVIEFHKLRAERKKIATITTDSRTYTASEIERFDYGSAPEG